MPNSYITVLMFPNVDKPEETGLLIGISVFFISIANKLS